MTNLFDILDDISFQKKGILDDNNIKDYNPFIINKFLSSSPDCLPFVQEMNLSWKLPKILQYQFYLKSLPKRKRYFNNVFNNKDRNLQIISEFFNVNTSKSKEILTLVNKNDIEDMKNKLNY